MNDLTGKRYDMLKVLNFVKVTPHYDNVWKCQCDCGKVVERNQSTLENTKRFHSCGCYIKQNLIPGDRERCSKAGKQRAKIKK